MDQSPSFVAPIDPKVETDADEVDHDRSDEDRVKPAVYADLFSARAVTNDAR